MTNKFNIDNQDKLISTNAEYSHTPIQKIFSIND